jgi:cardiolipin synthase
MIISFLLTNLVLIVGFMLAVVVIAHMLRQRRSPTATIAWLLAIVLLPYVGVPLYLLLGGRKMRRVVASKEKILLSDRAVDRASGACPMDRLLMTYGIPGAAPGNRVTLCETGEEAYERMVRLIEEACRSICVLTFILQDDEIGKDIVNRLARRAGEGIQVRMLMDGYGSLHISQRFLSPITNAGGRTAFFTPLLHRPLRGRTNLRNHRKIVIADEERVMAGGMNIGIEYIGPTPKPNRWRDLSFILEGPAVSHYVELFRSDWAFATGESFEIDAGRTFSVSCEGEGAIVQVVPSGPDMIGDSLYDAIISMVFMAKERIWIVTPYFIPDDPLSQALSLAAHRGVDVRVLVPEKSNHFVTDLARGAYLRDIQEAGGEILLYTGGMMHAKAMLVDHEIAMIGSANIDIRSLFLDYEVSLFIYSEKEIRAIQAWIETVMTGSRTGLKAPGFVRDLFEGITGIIAPLL